MPADNSAEDGPRIVLFGASGAGKSSLLGALAQAAQAQPLALGSQFTDSSGGLAELQKRTYDQKQDATQEEVVSYPVTLESEVAATLLDSDGRAAEAYLAGERSLEDGAALAKAVRGADAVVLAVAPAETGQLEQTFGQFTNLLRLFEQQRGRRSDIAGLPVFFVLTKCDLLARPGDTASAWGLRIDKGKHRLAEHFKEFLGRAQSPFGKIDLRVAACAIKRPALADSPARPREPYGVAELFRQVVAASQAFHQERARAQRRLRGAVFGLVALIALIGVIAAGYFLSLPSAEVAALENSIRAALPAPNAAAAQRLREPVEPKLRELSKIQENPEFAHLPSPLQEDVRQAAKEMAAYQELTKKVDALKRVRFFKKDEDVQDFTREIDNITLPAAYAAAWADTRLVKKIEQYRSELAALYLALREEKDWLKKQTKEGDELASMAIGAKGSPERQAWIKRADAFLRRKDLTKEAPGVPNMKLRELYEFPSVNRLREDYEAIRPRVDKIRGGLID